MSHRVEVTAGRGKYFVSLPDEEDGARWSRGEPRYSSVRERPSKPETLRRSSCPKGHPYTEMNIRWHWHRGRWRYECCHCAQEQRWKAYDEGRRWELRPENRLRISVYRMFREMARRRARNKARRAELQSLHEVNQPGLRTIDLLDGGPCM